jgi:aminoglycoside/choline kinase family phosphotransferase
MVDIIPLLSILNALPRTGDCLLVARDVTVSKLAGDASNRSYYRVTWKEGARAQSLILMVLADPEPFKASEEAVSGAASPITELPFINIHRHLTACGVAVPALVHYHQEKGWLLLEDLGDTLFAQEVMHHFHDTKRVIALYQNAIDLLIQMQHRATPAPVSRPLSHDRAFDQALFIWEFDHFIEYGIEKRQAPLPEKEKQAIRAIFSDIAFQLAMLPRVFTHRDYHSRNLMIQTHPREQIRVIDFQDALMGPCQYDLASLLRDSYIRLPEEGVNQLVDYYIGGWETATQTRIDPESFRVSFDLISIQRNLKAAGRFVFIDQVKKNPHFLPYVAPTLANVKTNLMKHKRLAPLYDLLASHVKELQ